MALLRIGTDPVGWITRGFAMGTSAHGIGAARALQVNADAGAWAAPALGLQVVTASLLIPLAARCVVADKNLNLFASSPLSDKR